MICDKDLIAKSAPGPPIDVSERIDIEEMNVRFSCSHIVPSKSVVIRVELLV